MEFEKLAELMFKETKLKLERKEALSIFAKHRAKFEGWLKVELCDILSKHFKNVVPERGRIDVTFENWAIELKTVNTNYRYPNVEKKTRPITMNVDEVKKDIESLKRSKYTSKAVFFVVFPAKHEKKEWQHHIQKISKELKEILHKEFEFKNGVPGILYFGLI